AIQGVDRELDAWRALEDADKALDEDAYSEAAASLKKVPDTSSFYQEAQDLLKDLRAEAIGESMANARKLVEEGKLKEALALLDKGLEIAPKDTDALALREQFRSRQAADEPRAAKQGAVKTKPPKKTAATQKTRKKAPPRKKKSEDWATDVKKPPEPTETSSGNRTGSGSRGLALYRAGNFAGAIDYFDSIANGSGSKRERSKAQHLATAITKFDTFWRVGREAVVSGRVEDAIDSLKKARKVDQSINGAWQGKIKRLMARQYAWKAERAYDRGDYPKAGKLARTAVNLDPSESTAAKIYSEVQRKAESWLAEARSMSASDPDRAMELLARVLSVFPRGDSRYQSAYRLLNQLGSDDDD
ncbi:MAG: hypothetical protein VX938_08515, partial [Myxococcota bacterium]|nr:hypothetical protein [Myxococcota bacterium]